MPPTGRPDFFIAFLMQVNNTVVRLLAGTYLEHEDAAIFDIILELPSGRVLRKTGFRGGNNPSYLCLTPDQRFMFAVNETKDFDAQGQGAVRMLQQINPGSWETVQTLSSGGALPAHCVFVPETSTLLTANYDNGSVGLLSFQNHRLQNVAAVWQLKGSGPDAARQAGPHAHHIVLSPDRKFFFVVDLGSDAVHTFTTDALKEQAFRHCGVYHTHAGWGPRHLAFHPDGRYAFLVHELSGRIRVLHYNQADGAFTAVSQVSAVPEDFPGMNKTAAIKVSSDGRFLYVSNRGYDSIAVFSIAQKDRQLLLLQQQTSGICWPREFALSPGGDYLMVANRHSDRLSLFRRDAPTGLLADTGISVPIPAPAFVKFLM